MLFNESGPNANFNWKSDQVNNWKKNPDFMSTWFMNVPKALKIFSIQELELVE